MRRRIVTLPTLARALGLALAATASLGAQGPARTIEPFDDARAFSAVPSDGVSLALGADSGIAGRALRMEFDFHGHAGYAVARRAFTLPALPPNWAMTLWVRGHALPNTLELKLVDSSGQNVWWMRRPDLQVVGAWTRLRFRASELSYAWGPLGGGAPRGIASLEIAFTAGRGGAGWIALDDLTLTPLAAPVADTVRPRVTASSSVRKQPADAAVPSDFFIAPRVARLWGDRAGWRSGADGVQWLALAFGGTRPLSGLVLDWSDTDWATRYDIEGSDDGRRWTLLRTVSSGASGRRFVHLPATEVAQLRLVMRESSRGRGYVLHALHILSDSAAPTRTAFLEHVAVASAPGMWPRPLTGQQSYWTVLGIPRDERDALLSEDGNVESRPGSFSLEPMITSGGRLLTWKDASTTHSLDGGWRPIPTVRRATGDVVLATTAFATGEVGASVIWVRYRVVNRSARTRDVTLVAAVRPVQVNPPWQFLGTPGGAATIGRLQFDARSVVVNDTDRVDAITSFASADGERFDAGGLAAVIPRTRASTNDGPRYLVDSTGFAEGAMRWPMRLGARDSADVWLALPAPGPAAARVIQVVTTREAAVALGEAKLAEARTLWDRELGMVQVELPGSGTALSQTLRSALAYVLINARGPAIQPGTRSYRRSWIRDGALTSSALMRLGHADDARAFLDWYVPRVFAGGKVPCCVDARGSDPVTENDADGELLYLAAEHFRITGDTATARRHWPTLSVVAAHLDSLRNSRRAAQYRTPDSLLVFGLLPPSISHEGYSAKPAYSYWDDWWGVRGLDDAGMLARAVRDSASAVRFTAAGREMRRDVVASVARSMQRHRLKTMPGAADLGDTDPTSSTIALEPAQALADLPRAAVLATFDSAWNTLQRRKMPSSRWDIYTPYEWRSVGAFIRLGQPERAHEYAGWLLGSRRPAAWNQWSEAVWREPRTPKFIGDMPHGWVLSDFARATLDMIAYEREGDSTLVVGAAIPLDWARAADGVRVRGVRTWWGALALTMRGTGKTVRVTVDGVRPPGGVELMAPFGAVPRAATVDGRPAAMTNGGRAVLLRGPAVVEFLY